MPVSFSPPQNRVVRARGAGVTAVLGPTNTGKTHLAIERMVAHSSGLIGLPLRLLAREVYNKVVDKAGPDAVALITGEEKIKPANPRFWVSTVEAMPRDLDVAFVAIDEIQLGADLERGHVFTDRMLHRRGREETLVLGAATARPMVEKLLPGAHILSRPRLSQLTFAGERKLTRLQRRAAIVAFSAEEVYAIAELIRRQRGGAAVVLGALSPRTRNAQVALYQSGDVEYIVATDAIGMGLNLDVEHVAFASDRKFDGYQFRRLTPAEFGQIAGRAGRATRDGTFGTTGRCPPFEPELVQALENHSFEPIKVMQWRNPALDFSSLGALQASLAAVPAEQALTRAPIAEDILVLEHAARDDAVRPLAKSRAAVERLWEVCQVPDYRKISPATHAELIITLYSFLMREGRIPTDWFSRQVAQADRTDGDIDTLSTRIAHIRTWTFAANRPDWLADPEHWQGVTRAVEDRLSDALHERLTERFVDRRTSVLMRRLRENTMLETEIARSGEVTVEGHLIGRLGGFQFFADPAAAGPEAKALRAAAQKALAGEIDQRALRLANASDDQFVLASDGVVRWLGEAVGKLMPGEEVLRPRIRIIADEHLSGAARDAVQARLELWTKTHIERLLGPLFALSQAEDVTGIARGIAFQLVEALGVIERHRVADEVRGLDQAARASLRKYGVRFGAYHLYLPALLKPGPRALAVQLWALRRSEAEAKGLDDVPHLAASGRTSIPVNKEVHRALYRTLGYRVCGDHAVRVDILERLADLIRPALAWREGNAGQRPPGAFDGSAFTVTPAMTSLIGASGEGLASILRSLGYRRELRPRRAVEVLPATTPGAAVAGDGMPVEEAPALPASDPFEVGAAASEGDPATATSAIAWPAGDLSPQAPEQPGSVNPALDVGEPRGEPLVLSQADLEAVVAAATTEVVGVEPSPRELEGSPDAAPDLVEVWRPGRPEERRGPRPSRRVDAPRPRPPVRASAASVSAPSEGAEVADTSEQPVSEPASISSRGGDTARQRRRGKSDDRGHSDQPDLRGRERRRAADRKASERPAGGATASPERERRPAALQKRPTADDHEQRPHGGRHGRRRDSDRAEWRSFLQQGMRKDHRDKAPDPDSPFAKLATLKERLEANAKERP